MDLTRFAFFCCLAVALAPMTSAMSPKSTKLKLSDPDEGCPPYRWGPLCSFFVEVSVCKSVYDNGVSHYGIVSAYSLPEDLMKYSVALEIEMGSQVKEASLFLDGQPTESTPLSISQNKDKFKFVAGISAESEVVQVKQKFNSYAVKYLGTAEKIAVKVRPCNEADFANCQSFLDCKGECCLSSSRSDSIQGICLPRGACPSGKSVKDLPPDFFPPGLPPSLKERPVEPPKPSVDHTKDHSFDCKAFDVMNQAGCGLCWAFATSSAYSMRSCIFSKGAVNTVISPQHVGEVVKKMQKGGKDYLYEGHGGAAVIGYKNMVETSILPFWCKPYGCKKISQKATSIVANFFGDWMDRLQATKALGLPIDKELEPYPSALRVVQTFVLQRKQGGPTRRKLQKALRDKKSFAVSAKDPQCEKAESYKTVDPGYKPITFFLTQYRLKTQTLYEELLRGPLASGIYADFSDSSVYKRDGDVIIPIAFPEKVNHDVTLIGWGTSASGRDYWLFQNSWGAEWNGDGRFKMQRGIPEECLDEVTPVGCGMDFFMSLHRRDSYSTPQLVAPKLDEDYLRLQAQRLETSPLACKNNGYTLTDGSCRCFFPWEGATCEVCARKCPSGKEPIEGDGGDDACPLCNCDDSEWGDHCQYFVEIAMCRHSGEERILLTQWSLDSRYGGEIKLMVERTSTASGQPLDKYDFEKRMVFYADNPRGHRQDLSEEDQLGQPIKTADEPFDVEVIYLRSLGTNEFGNSLGDKRVKPKVVPCPQSVKCKNFGVEIRGRCQCFLPFKGPTCEDCDLECANGGSLDEATCSCTCPEGYWGHRCDQFVEVSVCPSGSWRVQSWNLGNKWTGSNFPIKWPEDVEDKPVSIWTKSSLGVNSDLDGWQQKLRLSHLVAPYDGAKDIHTLLNATTVEGNPVLLRDCAHVTCPEGIPKVGGVCQCVSPWRGDTCQECAIKDCPTGVLDEEKCSCGCPEGFWGSNCENYFFGSFCPKKIGNGTSAGNSWEINFRPLAWSLEESSSHVFADIKGGLSMRTRIAYMRLAASKGEAAFDDQDATLPMSLMIEENEAKAPKLFKSTLTPRIDLKYDAKSGAISKCGQYLCGHGTQQDDGTCECPDGWEGKYCQTCGLSPGDCPEEKEYDPWNCRCKCKNNAWGDRCQFHVQTCILTATGERPKLRLVSWALSGRLYNLLLRVEAVSTTTGVRRALEIDEVEWRISGLTGVLAEGQSKELLELPRLQYDEEYAIYFDAPSYTHIGKHDVAISGNCDSLLVGGVTEAP